MGYLLNLPRFRFFSRETGHTAHPLPISPDQKSRPGQFGNHSWSMPPCPLIFGQTRQEISSQDLQFDCNISASIIVCVDLFGQRHW